MFYCFLELIIILALLIATFINEKYPFDKIRVIYIAPLLLTIMRVVVNGFEIKYLPAYVASIVIPLGMMLDKTIVRKMIAVASMLIILVTVFANALFVEKSYDYDRQFDEAFDTMREHYVLTEEKGIDWDYLYDKYLPQFETASRHRNGVENYKTWLKFTNEFHDGHTAFLIEKESVANKYAMQSFGNDYGLSIIRLSTGEYVAVNVEGYDNSYSIDSDEEDIVGFYKIKDNYLTAEAEEVADTLKNAGIKNGTVITKWNGKSVDEYYDDITYQYFATPVKENEAFFNPMYVAGIGINMEYGESLPRTRQSDKGEYALITYIDDNGNEQEIKAPCLGAYMPRLYDTISKIDGGVNITNLTWKCVDEETVILRISMMAYDTQSYGDPSLYTDMVTKLRGQVNAYKESGYKNIIIDMRQNCGGDPFFVQNVAGVFAPTGEHKNMHIAAINEESAKFERDENGKYSVDGVLTYEGEDAWHDGNIILLVNAECVSAGDDMTYLMGEYPNVKVMGITKTNSSCQAVTGIAVGDEGYLSFSAVPNIDENGAVVIDTLTDREGRTPFDEYIPFDKDSVISIFDKGEDYQINYIVENAL